LNDDLDSLVDDFKSKFIKLTSLSFQGDENDVGREKNKDKE